MGFLNLFKRRDMADDLAEFEANPKAVLLDVRTEEEYAGGHIPKSRNIPLMELDEVPYEFEDLETPLYLYCLSGARSSFAAEQLRDMGYTNIRDLGGLDAYHGALEQ